MAGFRGSRRVCYQNPSGPLSGVSGSWSPVATPPSARRNGGEDHPIGQAGDLGVRRRPISPPADPPGNPSAGVWTGRSEEEESSAISHRTEIENGQVGRQRPGARRAVDPGGIWDGARVLLRVPAHCREAAQDRCVPRLASRGEPSRVIDCSGCISPEHFQSAIPPAAVAVILVADRIFLIVILVVLFCRPELAGHHNLRCDGRLELAR